MRRLPATAVAVAALLVLAGCGASTVSPDPAGHADPSAAAKAQAALFDREYQRMDAGLTDGHPVRGTLYKHAAFGKRTSDEEFDTEFLGDPVTIFTRSRVLLSKKGGNLDVLHPAGSPYDYFLLGDLYKSIAPTPWARVPTNYSDPVNVCTITGYQTVCDMEDTVTITKEEGAQVTKKVTRNEDGTETLLTGVTLRSMLKYNYLLNVPADISSQFTKAMLDYELAARFVLDGKGDVRSASISGTVPGPTPFEAEVGFQATGAAVRTDFPAVPAAADVTAVDRTTFYKKLDAVNNG